jgi:hypothetical protein
MYDLHMHMYCYERAEVVLTVLDQSDFKVMPLNRRFERRIKGLATSVVASSFELSQRVLLLLASPQHPDLTRQLRRQSDI